MVGMDATMDPPTTGTKPSDHAKDPVCGMTVDPATTPHRHVHRGQTYFFCSGGCRTKFAADPGKYLDPSAREPAAPMPAGTIFTCPMHPEVRQEGPGACPICGMALEPEMPTRRRRAESRARRHDAAVLDRAGADACRWWRWRWAGICSAGIRCTPSLSNWVQLALRDAGRAVGRLAVLRARRAVARHAATSTCSR